jgi:hypothetical protein
MSAPFAKSAGNKISYPELDSDAPEETRENRPQCGQPRADYFAA